MRIEAVLSAHDDRARAEETTLRKLTLMKQGLMQDLLTGRVRVTKEFLEGTVENGQSSVG